MQDMLVPIFGENGAIIVQYVVTLAVVVALIVLVVWAIRHYSRGTDRPLARGKLPRLAIVDTLPLDGKRRLVLLRRDAVEHLVLIGGPTDVVIEPSIVRQRVAQRPGQAGPARPPQPQTAVPPEPPAPPTPVERPAPPLRPRAPADPEAPPTPPRRAPAAGERFAPPRREPIRIAPVPEPARAAPAEPARATRPAPAAPAPVEDDPEPPPLRFVAPSRLPAEAPPDGPVPGYEALSLDDQESVSDSAFAPPRDALSPSSPEERAGLAEDRTPEAGVGAGETAAAPAKADESMDDGSPAEGTGALEQEMARLLDQIATTRRE